MNQQLVKLLEAMVETHFINMKYVPSSFISECVLKCRVLEEFVFKSLYIFILHQGTFYDGDVVPSHPPATSAAATTLSHLAPAYSLSQIVVHLYVLHNFLL